MPLTASEARRAAELEEAAGKHRLTPEELDEYNKLALRSYERAIRKRLRSAPQVGLTR